MCLLFEESTGGYPNIVTCGDGFASFIEYSLGSFRRLEPGKSQPQFDREGDDLYGTREDDTSICRICLEVNSLFPEAY